MAKADQRLSELQLAFICKSLLSALSYMHKENYVHRDVKGGNILVTHDGTIKLADFGNVKQLTTVQGNTVRGSPLWMAPEMVLTGNFNCSVDIWSIGITVLELAEGQQGLPGFDLFARIPKGNAIDWQGIMNHIANSETPHLQNKIWTNMMLSFVDMCLNRDCTARKRYFVCLCMADKTIDYAVSFRLPLPYFLFYSLSRLQCRFLAQTPVYHVHASTRHEDLHQREARCGIPSLG